MVNLRRAVDALERHDDCAEVLPWLVAAPAYAKSASV
jgi:hypothetical protein